MGPPSFIDCSTQQPELLLHADTLKLITLWDAEVIRDQLLLDIASLQQSIDAAEVALAKAQQDIRLVEEEQEAKKTEEHTHSRRFHTYSKKRDETRELIDTGRAPDYEVAERQYASCAAIADEEETQLLEIMEQLDVISEKLKNTISVSELKEHQRDERKQDQADQLPGLQEQLDAATSVRDAARSDTPKHLMGRYDRLRTKELSCVVPIVSGACSGCRMKVTSVHLAEHKRGATTHHCKNCGRFLGALN
ncbi:MAG: C4-type zinc ribbon domain-containing protein [Myxococcota bacterium]|nr:C4-type zinc ribbon domain-containing protein [Myxococcota bacterium]